MIHFQDIQFRYEGTISSEIGVKDINLIVHTGECVLLCGRSGCGKTTLTKLINGLIPNYFPGELSGNVQIDDENILGMPMYYLATKVGSVFQNPRTQFFNVDVDSEIAFGIENIAVPPDECHKFIVLISLVELLHTVEAAAVDAFGTGILGAIYAQCNNGAFSISDKNGGNHICCSCAFCISLPDNRGFISYSSLHCWDSDMRDPPHISSCGCAVPYRKVWQAYCRLCPEADMHCLLAIFALSIR